MIGNWNLSGNTAREDINCKFFMTTDPISHNIMKHLLLLIVNTKTTPQNHRETERVMKKLPSHHFIRVPTYFPVK